MSTHSTISQGARRVAGAAGICVGISGLDHGFFEILQGNKATPSLVIQAIGPDQQMWESGTEEAFTVVPNFLVTGILAMLVGTVMIIWSTRFMHVPNASRGFLLIGLLMFTVGGGIGMLVFLLFGWAIARRIERPPAWWSRPMPGWVSPFLSRSWRGLIALGVALYVFGIQIAITGYVPGVSDPNLALAICWGSLLAMLPVLTLAVVGSSQQPAARLQVVA